MTVLKVDIDTTDDEAIVAEVMRTLTAARQPVPHVVIVEYESRIPPPFRYRCLRTMGVSFDPFYGCQPSLSYWVHMLGRYSYSLYRVSDRDLVFFQDQLAHQAALRDKVNLPFDEVACYLYRRLHRFEHDLDEALQLLSCNMSTEGEVTTALDRILHKWAPIDPRTPGTSPDFPRYSVPVEISHPAFDKEIPDRRKNIMYCILVCSRPGSDKHTFYICMFGPVSGMHSFLAVCLGL